MEHRAWKWVRFIYPSEIPTMLRPEETQYFYWLGASVCMGKHASGRPSEGRLHAVDNFLWRDFMVARAALPLQPGESFEPYFLKNLQTYADLVVSHAARLIASSRR